MEIEIEILFEEMEELHKRLRTFNRDDLFFHTSGFKENMTPRQMKRQREKASKDMQDCIESLSSRIRNVEEEFVTASKELQKEIKELKADLSYQKFQYGTRKNFSEVRDCKADLKKLETRRMKINKEIQILKANPFGFKFRTIKEIKGVKNQRWLTKFQGFRGVPKWEISKVEIEEIKAEELEIKKEEAEELEIKGLECENLEVEKLKE